MGAQYHNGHWYGGGQNIDIQSDPTATSFDANKVPTGATAESVLNSKLGNFIKAVTLTGKVTLPTLPSGNAGYTVGVTSGHGGAGVTLSTLPNFPTGKTILGVIPYDCTYTGANYVKGYLYTTPTTLVVYGRPGLEYQYSIGVIYIDD